MSNGYDSAEEEFQANQASKLYPVGRSLRTTFPAPDGEDLQPRITTLMVELAHQPYERDGNDRLISEGPPCAADTGRELSLLSQIARLFRRVN
jgi:hypothetical protein